MTNPDTRGRTAPHGDPLLDATIDPVTVRAGRILPVPGAAGMFDHAAYWDDHDARDRRTLNPLSAEGLLR